MDPLLALDKSLGNAIERLVRSHHRRRLRRLGWERALDPPGDGLWAAGESAVRGGNAIEVLVDGAEALPRMAAEIRKARSHVHIAAWHISPWFDLTNEGVELRPLLAELAERVDVRMLLWAGSPLPLFHPDRQDVTESGTGSRSEHASRSPSTRRSGRCTAITRSSSSSTAASRSSAAST